MEWGEGGRVDILYSDFSWCRIGKNLDGSIFPSLTNMCHKTNVQIKYEMIRIVIVLIVLIKLQ